MATTVSIRLPGKWQDHLGRPSWRPGVVESPGLVQWRELGPRSASPREHLCVLGIANRAQVRGAGVRCFASILKAFIDN